MHCIKYNDEKKTYNNNNLNSYYESGDYTEVQVELVGVQTPWYKLKVK